MYLLVRWKVEEDLLWKHPLKNLVQKLVNQYLKNTSFLVVGNNVGNKLEDAKEKEVNILTEAECLAHIKTKE